MDLVDQAPKKKVVFVLKGYPRVSETFIAQEIYLLQEKGFDIEILSMRQPREPQRQPIVKKIHAPVTYIPEYILQAKLTYFVHNLKVFCKRPLVYTQGLLESAFSTVLRRDKSPLKRFLQAAWVVSSCDLFSRDIHLHSHFIHTPTEMTLAITKLTGLRYSISAHAKDIYTIPKKDVVKRINASEFITTCTRFNFEFIKRLEGVDQSKVDLNYHGIDAETFAPSEKHCLSEKNPFRLVSVGRLVEKKGYDIIFEALEILKAKNVSFLYEIYGAGDLETQLKELVVERGLKQNVKFHLTATHPDIIERFQDKGIFLCGSKVTKEGDRDGIPNTLAEAMSMELAVVATKVSGIPELVTHKESGYLIDSNSADQMVEAIEFLIENPEKAENFAKAGRRKVIDFFNAKSRINNLEAMLSRLL